MSRKSRRRNLKNNVPQTMVQQTSETPVTKEVIDMIEDNETVLLAKSLYNSAMSYSNSVDDSEEDDVNESEYGSWYVSGDNTEQPDIEDAEENVQVDTEDTQVSKEECVEETVVEDVEEHFPSISVNYCKDTKILSISDRFSTKSFNIASLVDDYDLAYPENWESEMSSIFYGYVIKLMFPTGIITGKEYAKLLNKRVFRHMDLVAYSDHEEGINSNVILYHVEPDAFDSFMEAMIDASEMGVLPSFLVELKSLSECSTQNFAEMINGDMMKHYMALPSVQRSTNIMLREISLLIDVVDGEETDSLSALLKSTANVYNYPIYSIYRICDFNEDSENEEDDDIEEDTDSDDEIDFDYDDESDEYDDDESDDYDDEDIEDIDSDDDDSDDYGNVINEFPDIPRTHILNAVANLELMVKLLKDVSQTHFKYELEVIEYNVKLATILRSLGANASVMKSTPDFFNKLLKSSPLEKDELQRRIKFIAMNSKWLTKNLADLVYINSDGEFKSSTVIIDSITRSYSNTCAKLLLGISVPSELIHITSMQFEMRGQDQDAVDVNNKAQIISGTIADVSNGCKLFSRESHDVTMGKLCELAYLSVTSAGKPSKKIKINEDFNMNDNAAVTRVVESLGMLAMKSFKYSGIPDTLISYIATYTNNSNVITNPRILGKFILKYYAFVTNDERINTKVDKIIRKV